jgi:uncharacterized protein
VWPLDRATGGHPARLSCAERWRRILAADRAVNYVARVQMVTTESWERVAQRVEEARDTARRFAAQAHAHFGSRLRDIRLFGSAARGDWQEDSDVDVMVLLDEVRSDDRDWIAAIATKEGLLGCGVLLSTVTLPEREFLHLRERERLFAREVDREGMPL